MPNIFKQFRTPGQILNIPSLILNLPGTINKTFDEPTYLTFRLEFLPANTDMNHTNYDKMPMPLFDLSKSEGAARNHYSAIQYLQDSNEVGRAEMMETFINQWNQIQKDYQYYFQEISGLDALFKVDPARGIRISKEGRITLKMLDGLDWRITHLLNLYRKIAWDDTYQRWILPDMMRYFALNIYITEFRLFQQSRYTEQAALGASTTPTDDMILQAAGDVMPTWVFRCERCEFDITTLNSYITDLKVNEETMTEVSFDIKVGQLSDEYVNPILDYWYWDPYLNGIGRTADSDPSLPSRTSILSRKLLFLNTEATAGGISHTSGKPFLETSGSGTTNVTNSNKAMLGPSADINPVNPVQPSTWLGNTMTLGKAFVKNLVGSQVDKAKISPIPGLGFSFTEALAAIQSKNVFAVFALAREAITQSVAKTTPSQELDNKIIDKTLKQFIRGVANSQATQPETQELVKAANLILNDKGQWEKLKDFSLATDLVSSISGEVNISNTVKNKNTEKDVTLLESGGTLSLATNLGGIIGPMIIEGAPSSTATTNKIEK